MKKILIYFIITYGIIYTSYSGYLYYIDKNPYKEYKIEIYKIKLDKIAEKIEKKNNVR